MSAVVLQALVLSGVLGWSMALAFDKLFPMTSRRLRARAARVLARGPAALRSFATRLEARRPQGGSCADGCASCGGCGTTESAPPPRSLASAIPLRFVAEKSDPLRR